MFGPFTDPADTSISKEILQELKNIHSCVNNINNCISNKGLDIPHYYDYKNYFNYLDNKHSDDDLFFNNSTFTNANKKLNKNINAVNNDLKYNQFTDPYSKHEALLLCKSNNNEELNEMILPLLNKYNDPPISLELAYDHINKMLLFATYKVDENKNKNLLYSTNSIKAIVNYPKNKYREVTIDIIENPLWMATDCFVITINFSRNRIHNERQADRINEDTKLIEDFLKLSLEEKFKYMLPLEY